MATSKRCRRARLGLARLRVEHRDGEIGVGERYSSPPSAPAQPSRHAHARRAVEHPPVEADGFEHAHLHGLIEHRVAREHIAGATCALMRSSSAGAIGSSCTRLICSRTAASSSTGVRPRDGVALTRNVPDGERSGCSRYQRWRQSAACAPARARSARCHRHPARRSIHERVRFPVIGPQAERRRVVAHKQGRHLRRRTETRTPSLVWAAPPARACAPACVPARGQNTGARA